MSTPERTGLVVLIAGIRQDSHTENTHIIPTPIYLVSYGKDTGFTITHKFYALFYSARKKD